MSGRRDALRAASALLTSLALRARASERTPRTPALLYGVPLPLPARNRWRLNVYYGDYRSNQQLASLDYAVEHDGARYRVRTEGRAEGLAGLIYSGVLVQSSAGRLSVNGLAPERYSEQRGRRPERWVRIDYEARRVEFSNADPVELVDGAQDRLSMLLQLGLLARASPQRFVAGAAVELPEIASRTIESVRYLSHGESAIETVDGPLRALHLERSAPHRQDDTRFEVWLGYDHGMLPVRIRLTDAGGRALDHVLAR